jgi:glucose/mannose-6-phosphate isomerase
MTNLDNAAQIRRLDTKNMLGSIEKMADQVIETYKLAGKLKLPAVYKKINRVVVFGMGGSALGAHFIRSVFAPMIKVPVGIVNDYDVPAFVNKDTLVILSSYSGNTEETLSAFEQAIDKGAKVVVISAGGELEHLGKLYKIPTLIFTTKNNPCGSPRMGLGYSIAALASVLARAGLIKFGQFEIKKIGSAIAAAQKEFGVANRAGTNLAKRLAAMTSGRTVWFIGSGFLTGNMHIAANQMNENAKRFAGYFLIPELNHHLMEGMANPLSNRDDLLFLLFQSALYSTRIKKRFSITEEVLAKNGITFEPVVLKQKTLLEQAFEALVFSGYFSFYSAMVENIDPTPNILVDYFKSALKK